MNVKILVSHKLFSSVLLISFFFLLLFPQTLALAQNQTSTTCTKVGAPAGSAPAGCGNQVSLTGNNIADLAQRIVAAATQNCNANSFSELTADYGALYSAKQGVVQESNYTCLQNALPSILQQMGYSANQTTAANAVADGLEDTFSGVTFYDCWGLIKTVMAGLFGSETAYGGGGFTVSTSGTIQVGDVISLPGHWVIAINTADNGSAYQVAEANYCFYGWLNNNVNYNCRGSQWIPAGFGPPTVYRKQ